MPMGVDSALDYGLERDYFDFEFRNESSSRRRVLSDMGLGVSVITLMMRSCSLSASIS